MEESKDPIQTPSLLQKIKEHEISVKPKAYFTFKFVALILLITAIIGVSLFLSSLIIFTLRASGHASLIGFGPSGTILFLALFPWKWLAIELLLLVLLEWLLRSFSFGYKVPVLPFLGIILGFSLLISFALDRIHIHDALFRLSGEHHLPLPIDGVYDRARRPPPVPEGRGIFEAVIQEVGTSSFQVLIERPASTSLRIMLPEEFEREGFERGERIFIRGELHGENLEAREIRHAHP